MEIIAPTGTYEAAAGKENADPNSAAEEDSETRSE